MRDNIVKTVLVLTLLVWTGIAMGQSEIPPVPNITIPNPGTGSQGTPLEVCPGETTRFGVPINETDAGDISTNQFEWIVYGGEITILNGVLVSGTETLTSASGSSYTYHLLTTTGITNTANIDTSKISITWDTSILADIEQPFIAVRQIPESGCEDNWSVFYVDITAPTMNCPSESPYAGSCASAFTIPSTTTSKCSTVSLLLSWTIDKPVGDDLTGTITIPAGSDTFTGSPGDFNLPEGTSSVTYTLSDMSKTHVYGTCNFNIEISDEKPVINKTLSEFAECSSDEKLNPQNQTYPINMAESLALIDSDITDDCTDFSALIIEYQITNEVATPVDGSWTEGNPSSFTVNEGINRIWYRVTDESGNVSDYKHIYTLTVYHTPNPSEITAN
ncbi:hypothetical protein EYV94_03260 [Puteibacter caeruleilacunae]|nr:hypothetical protein EYV94_03260 [Puteibacter caeruleilacunae]